MKMRQMEKNKILFLIGCIFLFLSLNLVFFLFLSVESLRYTFVLNVLLSIFFYFILFGRTFHPILIFIGTLTLFQGGLIISSIFDNSIDLSYVSLMGADFFLKEDTVRLTILLICSSYWFAIIGAYIGSEGKIKNLKEAKEFDNNFLKQIFLIIFFIALPFYIYKQLIYFNYFTQYGYIGFYQSTKYLEEAGFIVRSISFLVPIAFLGFFFLERNKKIILLISFIFFIISLPVLISGFRGWFFTFWLTVFLFYKQKFNNKISFKYLFMLIIIFSTIGLFISYTRENPSLTSVFNLQYIFNILINRNPILEFLKQQGVSFWVTAMAVEFEYEFSSKIFKYLLWEPIAGIYPHIPTAFAHDLTQKINYNAYLMGYGTGSSYLAEAYLLGGFLAVFLASLLIGYVLGKLNSFFHYVNIYKKILIFTVFQYIFFIPRDLLLMPIAQAIKTGVYLIMLFFIIVFIKQVATSNKRKRIKNENCFDFK